MDVARMKMELDFWDWRKRTQEEMETQVDRAESIIQQGFLCGPPQIDPAKVNPAKLALVVYYLQTAARYLEGMKCSKPNGGESNE